MKRIVTLCTPDISDCCSQLIENQIEYAHRRGYEHHCATELHWPQLAASFSKVHVIREALLNNAQTVIWADVDVGFIDMTRELEDLLAPDYWLAAYWQKNLSEWKYLCAGLIVIRNCPKALSWADWMVAKIESMENTTHPWENWYFDEWNRITNFDGVRACDATEIGCFAPEIWNDGVLWGPDCPTVHLAGPASWERRRDVFAQKYLPLVKR